MSWGGVSAEGLADLARQHSFGRLVAPGVGLVEAVDFLQVEPGAPAFEVASASLGNLGMTLPHVHGAHGGEIRDEIIGGAGSGPTAQGAWLRAVVEAAERYATMVYDEADFVVGSQVELGEEALRLEELPRCSEAELGNPACPVTAPDPQSPMRWVRGWSLTARRPRLVPAVMAHLYLHPWPSERFWLPISTGVAAHTSLESALLGAVCEGVERDAMALAWLGRRPLARLECPHPSPRLAEVVGRFEASNTRAVCFDATTDLGVPTVFSVQLTDGHPTCSLAVSCATAVDAELAWWKALREAASARSVLNRPHPLPDAVEDYYDIVHGAHHYGRGGQHEDFDFLLDGRGGTTSLDALRARSGLGGVADDAEALRILVERLATHGVEAVAVDLTTDELRAVGLWAVRVVTTRLLPISFVHRARFLGSPRLYEMLSRELGRPFTEAEVNPGPLPFA